MSKNFNKDLIELLKTDPRSVDDEGELVKAAVIDRVWKIDWDFNVCEEDKKLNRLFYGDTYDG